MRFITAQHIFSGKEFLKPRTVIVLNKENEIVDLVSTEIVDASNIEYFEGVISPGFINTHCHLELSHLHNQIDTKTGIVNFALDVIKKRNIITPEKQIEAMHNTDALMQENGIVAVGDISNTSLSIEVKKSSSIYYHTFVELIGLNPQKSETIFNTGLDLLNDFKSHNLSCSLAPHAPYTASKELIELISNECFDHKKITSIHNQESVEENNFFTSKSGDFLKLYNTLNIDIDFFKATQKSSLQSVIQAFNKNINTLLVHNTFTNKADIEFAQALHNKLFWCLCPNANLYIENTLPNIDLLISQNCEMTIGSDSLASNYTLSIIEEINTIKKQFPHLELGALLKMATYNGAKFLGIENEFGLIEKGRKSGLNLITENDGNFSVKRLS